MDSKAVGFSRLSVTGYKHLQNVSLELGPVNVLVGPNGVGKSSVLDVFYIMASSAEATLEASIADYGGMTSLLTADGHTDTIEIKLDQTSSREIPRLEYMMRLVREGYGYAISRELLTQQRQDAVDTPVKFIDSTGSRIRYRNGGKLISPNWEHKPLETSLAQAPKMYREAESFRQQLNDVSPIYHSLDVSFRAPVRMPQQLTTARTPGNDGEELLSCLYTMRETERDRFDAVEDALRAAFPTFDRLDFPPLAGGVLTLGWRERGLARAVFANDLSEGTLRFLWLVTLLQSPGLPKVTLIDEPEVSLHPEMLRLLAELMREAADRTQLIVATHSDRLVRFLNTSELVLCDRAEDGNMRVERASSLDLGEWMSHYTLDQLWNMGRLQLS
jgi:predicted ATPase